MPRTPIISSTGVLAVCLLNTMLGCVAVAAALFLLDATTGGVSASVILVGTAVIAFLASFIPASVWPHQFSSWYLGFSLLAAPGGLVLAVTAVVGGRPGDGIALLGFTVAAVAAGVVGQSVGSRAAKPDYGSCEGCGYDLRGSDASVRCPECGFVNAGPHQGRFIDSMGSTFGNDDD